MRDVSAQPTPADSARPEPLSRYTTLRLGGAPQELVTAEHADEMVQTIRRSELNGHPVLILAGGSNVVVGDSGFPGTVLLVRSRGIGRNGAETTIEAVFRDRPLPALVVNGNARLNGNPSIMGDYGAVHANGETRQHVVAVVGARDDRERKIGTEPPDMANVLGRGYAGHPEIDHGQDQPLVADLRQGSAQVLGFQDDRNAQ